MDEKDNEAAEAANGDTESVDDSRKPWTVLTFLGGENNLSDEMVFAIKAMKSSVHIPLSSAGNVKFKFHALVQFAAEYSALPNPVRFKLKPGDFDGSAHADYEETKPQDRAPSWQGCNSYVCEMVDFLYWGIKKAPADRYFVIFSGHGNGIESNFLKKDTVPPQSLSIKELRTVLEHRDVIAALQSVGKDRIDIIGFDSCLMSMVEVCYELRDDAHFLIASEGNEANLGWPYRAIFEYLQSSGNPSAEELAEIAVNSMAQYYADFSIIANSSADISACNLDAGKIAGLKNAIDTLGRQMLKYLPEKTDGFTIEKHEFLRPLIFAHWYAQTYRNDQYTDLADFCDVLARNLNSGLYSDVIESCKNVSAAVSEVVSSRCYTGPMYQYSKGVSIYFPWSEIYPPYKDRDQLLDFLKDTCWLKFIHSYIEKTQRPRNPGHNFDGNAEKFRVKDDFPRSRGSDDPSARAKNPPHNWDVPDCLWSYFETLLQ